jgi:hypothetical protein
METQITLPGNHPALSVRLLRNGEKFLLLSLDYPFAGEEEYLLCLLNHIEAFTLWDFLDRALENTGK